MRAYYTFFVLGSFLGLLSVATAQDATSEHPQPSFRFLFRILRYEKLPSGGHSQQDDDFGLMKPLDWDSGGPRPNSGLGLATDSVMFGCADIWSPYLQGVSRKIRMAQLRRSVASAPTGDQPKAPDPEKRPRVEIVPFEDGRIVKTQVTVKDGTDGPNFVWGARLDGSFAVSHQRAFAFWLENRWPPGSLPVGTFRMVASVRVRVVYGDGTVFLTEVSSMPEEVEIVKGRRSFNATSPYITSVYSWLTFLEMGVDWEHSDELYKMVLKAFREGSRVEGYGDSGEMDFKLANAAFLQGDYETSYEAFHRAFLAGTPLSFDPAKTLKRIGQCVDQTGKPDFSKDTEWLRAFRRLLPRY